MVSSILQLIQNNMDYDLFLEQEVSFIIKNSQSQVLLVYFKSSPNYTIYGI